MLKAGFAGDTEPKCVFPSMCGYPPPLLSCTALLLRRQQGTVDLPPAFFTRVRADRRNSRTVVVLTLFVLYSAWAVQSTRG